MEQVNVKSPAVDVPDPSVADRLNVRGYGEKVAKSVMEQIRPKWQELQAKANEMMAAKKSAQEARDTLAEQTKHLKPIADALRPLNDSERQSVARAVVSAAGSELPRKRIECGNETWSAAPPGQTAIEVSADSLALLLGLPLGGFAHALARSRLPAEQLTRIGRGDVAFMALLRSRRAGCNLPDRGRRWVHRIGHAATRSGSGLGR